MHCDLSDSSVHMNVICLIWLQLIFLVVDKHAPLLILKVLYRVHQSCTPSLCFSLWGKHRGHFCGFSHRLLIVTGWLAEAAQVIGRQEPSCIVLVWCYCCKEVPFPWELWLVFPRESQLQQSHTTPRRHMYNSTRYVLLCLCVLAYIVCGEIRFWMQCNVDNLVINAMQ